MLNHTDKEYDVKVVLNTTENPLMIIGKLILMKEIYQLLHQIMQE